MADTISQSMGKAVEAAKKYASSNDSNDPDKEENHQMMVKATNNLRNVSSDVVRIMNTRKHFEKLASLCGQLVTNGNIAVEATNQSKHSITDNTLRAEFNKSSNHFKEALDQITEFVKTLRENPTSPGAQLGLLNEARGSIPYVIDFLKNSAFFTDAIEDEKTKKDIQNKCDDLKASLTNVVEYFQKTESFTNALKYAAAQEALDAEIIELNQMENKTDGRRKVSDGYSEISHLINRQNTVMAVIRSIEEALEAGDINEIRSLMVDLGDSVRDLAKSAKNAASTAEEKEQAIMLIETAKSLIMTAGSYLDKLNKYDESREQNLSEDIDEAGVRLNMLVKSLGEKSRAVFDSLGSENRLLDLKLKIDRSLNNLDNQGTSDVQQEGLVLINAAQKILDEYDKILAGKENQVTESGINRKRRDFEEKLEEFKVSHKVKTGAEYREIALIFGSEVHENLEFISRFVLLKELAKETQIGSDVGEKVIKSLDNFADNSIESRADIFGESIDIMKQSLLDLQQDGSSSIAQYNLVNDTYDFLWNGKNLLKTVKDNFDEESNSALKDDLHDLNVSINNVSKLREKIADLNPLDFLVSEEIVLGLQSEFQDYKDTFNTGKVPVKLTDNEKEIQLEKLKNNIVEVSVLLNNVLSSAVENDNRYIRSSAVKLSQSLEYFEKVLQELIPQPEFKDFAGHTLNLNENLLDEAVTMFSLIKVLNIAF